MKNSIFMTITVVILMLGAMSGCSDNQMNTQVPTSDNKGILLYTTQQGYTVEVPDDVQLTEEQIAEFITAIENEPADNEISVLTPHSREADSTLGGLAKSINPGERLTGDVHYFWDPSEYYTVNNNGRRTIRVTNLWPGPTRLRCIWYEKRFTTYRLLGERYVGKGYTNSAEYSSYLGDYEMLRVYVYFDFKEDLSSSGWLVFNVDCY